MKLSRDKIKYYCKPIITEYMINYDTAQLGIVKKWDETETTQKKGTFAALENQETGLMRIKSYTLADHYLGVSVDTKLVTVTSRTDSTIQWRLQISKLLVICMPKI